MHQMPKAYSYIRFSSAEQAKGRSHQRQLEASAEYCSANGLSLALDAEYTFLDRGKSAFKAEHLGDDGQLARFLRLVDDGSVQPGSYLIVESLDRLSREHVTYALPRFMALLARDIRIVTLTDQRVYTKDYTELDLIMSIFVMSRAHEESVVKGRRVGDAWRVKQDKAREDKRPLSRMCPLWLELHNGNYQIVEDKANTVRRIYQLTIDGYGKSAVCKALNADGIPTFKGGTWGTSSIGKVLGNRAVLGEYQPYSRAQGGRQPKGSPILHFYPPVIDESTFYQALEATSSRRTNRVTKQSANFNVYQGIVRCTKCQSAMYLGSKGPPPYGKTYLSCAASRKGLCDSKAVRIELAESAFKEILAKVDSLALVRDSSASIARNLEEITGRIRELDENLRQCGQRAKTPPFSQTLWNVIDELERELTVLKAQRNELEVSLATETIINKQEFFNQLDLASYEGRYRANALLKRLKICVYLDGLGRGKLRILVLQERQPILTILISNNEFTIGPMSDKSMELMTLQEHDGTLQRAAMLFELEMSHAKAKGVMWSEELFNQKLEALLNGSYSDIQLLD